MVDDSVRLVTSSQVTSQLHAFIDALRMFKAAGAAPL